MDLKKVLLGILTTALGLTAEKAEELIGKPEDSLKEILKIHKDQVSALKSEITESFDDGYKKAQGEAYRKLERELKAEHSIESSAKGLELIKEIIAANAKAEGKESKVLTDDEIKKHPMYLKLEKDSKKAVEEAKAEAETKIKDLETSYTEKETFKTVEKKIADEITGLKIALHSNPEKAEKQKAAIVKELKAAGYKWDLKGESVLVLKADGTRLEDEHGHSIPLGSLVKNTAEELGFDFQASEARTSADPAGVGATEEPAGKKIEVPKNEAEYVAKLTDPNISTEDKLAIKEAYNKAT